MHNQRRITIATIIRTDSGDFVTDNGHGTSLKLRQTKYGWEGWADNAARRVWKSPGIKVFNTLKEVESNYKCFRGISALIEKAA
jgi:hypothetical protein